MDWPSDKGDEIAVVLVVVARAAAFFFVIRFMAESSFLRMLDDFFGIVGYLRSISAAARVAEHCESKRRNDASPSCVNRLSDSAVVDGETTSASAGQKSR